MSATTDTPPQIGSYATMQVRILDEVLGAITTQHIVNAINDAIAKYQRKRFWFNEGILQGGGTLDGTPPIVLDAYVLDENGLYTVVGQEFYSATDLPAIGTMASISHMVLIQGNSNRYRLRPRTPQWMDDNSVGMTWRGMPTDWAYEAEQIRFYPIPDQVYSIIMWGTVRVAALNTDTNDTNIWVSEAEELIRMAAESILYRRVLRDNDMANMCAADEAQALKSLIEETSRRKSTSRLRGSSWF